MTIMTGWQITPCLDCVWMSLIVLLLCCFMHLAQPPVLFVCLSAKPLHPLTTLQNNEPILQVLKQFVNLSFFTGLASREMTINVHQ